MKIEKDDPLRPGERLHEPGFDLVEDREIDLSKKRDIENRTGGPSFPGECLLSSPRAGFHGSTP